MKLRYVPLADGSLELACFERERAPLIVFCHGFPGTYKHYDLAEMLQAAGYSVAILKYRGVDGSSGTFNFRNAISDLAETVRHIERTQLAPEGLGLFGYSAGAYYAVNVAAMFPTVRSLCLLSPVSDLPRAARAPFENIYDLMLSASKTIRIAGMHDLVASFADVWRDFNVLERVRELRVPLTIIEGSDVARGDPEHARLLFDAATGPKRLAFIRDADHFFLNAAVRSEIADIARRHFAETLLGAPA